MRIVVLAVALVLTAAAPPAPPPASRFDAVAFFTGATEGRGRLKIMTRRTVDVAVHGIGRIDPDGTLVLNQIVERAGRADTHREWRIRPAGAGRYTGSLSDAAGPVTGQAAGDQLHLSYRGRGGVAIDQWLTLSPDARAAHNVLTARKLGVVVARLDETIRKTD